jgi:hypothetical protein
MVENWLKPKTREQLREMYAAEISASDGNLNCEEGSKGNGLRLRDARAAMLWQWPTIAAGARSACISPATLVLVRLAEANDGVTP